MNVRISKTIYISKAFAALSIICAHCNYVSADYSAANLFCSNLLSSFGSIGVGIFLFLSGYLLHGIKHSLIDFLKRKITTFLLPWAFCGTFVYLYVHLRKGGLGMLSLAKWLIGVDTYLYFMTVLGVQYLVCFIFRKNRIMLFVFMGLSVASNILTALGVIQIFHGYLNPLNFMVYFASGLLIADLAVLENLMEYCRKIWQIALVGLLFLLLIFAYNSYSINYFQLYYIPIEAVAFLVVLGASTWFADGQSVLIQNVGKASFAIYLLHMPIAGIVANIFNRVDFFVLTLVRPLVVIAVVYITVWLMNRIFPKGKALDALNILIGMR